MKLLLSVILIIGISSTFLYYDDISKIPSFDRYTHNSLRNISRKVHDLAENTYSTSETKSACLLVYSFMIENTHSDIEFQGLYKGKPEELSNNDLCYNEINNSYDVVITKDKVFFLNFILYPLYDLYEVKKISYVAFFFKDIENKNKAVLFDLKSQNGLEFYKDVNTMQYATLGSSTVIFRDNQYKSSKYVKYIANFLLNFANRKSYKNTNYEVVKDDLLSLSDRLINMVYFTEVENVINLPPNFFFELFKQEEDLETECAICLGLLSRVTKGEAYFPCSHNEVFHESCIINWLINHNTCPICRAKAFERGREFENPEAMRRKKLFHQLLYGE